MNTERIICFRTKQNSPGIVYVSPNASYYYFTYLLLIARPRHSVPGRTVSASGEETPVQSPFLGIHCARLFLLISLHLLVRPGRGSRGNMPRSASGAERGPL